MRVGSGFIITVSAWLPCPGMNRGKLLYILTCPSLFICVAIDTKRALVRDFHTLYIYASRWVIVGLEEIVEFAVVCLYFILHQLMLVQCKI